MMPRRSLALVAFSGLCSFAALLGHAYIGLSARFMADTFCYAATMQAQNLMRAQLAWYRTWTGRFALNLLESLVGAIGPRVAPYLPALALALWLLSLTAVLLQFLRSSDPATPLPVAVSLASLILYVTLVGIPNVAQSLYWSNSMHNYVSPLIAAPLYTSLILFARERWRTHRLGLLWLALIVIVAFIAGGFSEMATALQTATLAATLMASLLYADREFRRQAVPLLMAALVGMLAALALVFVAPGNKVRQAYFPPPPAPFVLLRMALDYSCWFLLGAAKRAPLPMLSTLAIPTLLGAMSSSSSSLTPASLRGRMRALLWLPLVSFALLVSCFAAAAYGLSSPPADRAAIVPQYFLVCSLVAWAYIAGQTMRHAQLKRFPDRKLILWKVVLVSAVLLTGLHTLKSTYGMMVGSTQFRAYATAWDARDRSIREARAGGASRVVIPLIENPAGLEDIGPDANHWVNLAVSQYYGLKVLSGIPLPIPAVDETSAMIAVDAHIDGAAEVLGWTIDQTVAQAGQVLRVTVYWRPSAATEQPCTAFVHLYTPQSELLAQCDQPPHRGDYPTTAWVYGSPFADTFEIALPDPLPATGPATLVLGLYDPQTMARLPAQGADADSDSHWVRLGSIELAP